MKYGIGIIYGDGSAKNSTFRNKLIQEIFEGITLSDYTFDNVESEIYILDKEVIEIKGPDPCSWDLYGENELVEIQKRNHKHFIWNAFICFLKNEVPEIKLYCFDRKFCDIYIKNESDYKKILGNIKKYRYKYEIYNEQKVSTHLKCINDSYGYKK